jgi:serine/threonine protein kinase
VRHGGTFGPCVAKCFPCQNVPHFSLFDLSLLCLPVWVVLVYIILKTQTQTQTELLTQTQECHTQMADYDDDEDDGEVSNLSPCPPLSPPPLLPWGRLLPCSELNNAYNLMPRAPGLEQDYQPAAAAPPHEDDDNNDDNVTAGHPPLQNPPSLTPPRPPPRLLNLHQVTPSDIFNIHWLGRSQSCDVTVTVKPKKVSTSVPNSPVPSSKGAIVGAAAAAAAATSTTSVNGSSNSGSSKSAKKIKHEAAMQVWAHSMISNQHCRIFCVLSELAASAPPRPPTAATTSLSSSISPMVIPSLATTTPTPTPVVMHHSFEVYVENMSANGTLINQTTLLQKGEKRLLHSGDEICLVNPNVLSKKCRSRRILNTIAQNYSFVFVNEQQKRRNHHHPSLVMTIAGLSLYPPKRKQGCVNPRAMNYFNTNNTTNTAITNNNSNNNRPNHPNGSRVGPSHGDKSPTHRPHHHPSSWARRIEAVYDLREVLGDGTCGQVRRAIHRSTGEQCAVKIIPLRRNRQFLDATQMEQEANILRSLDHPYIVKLIDVFVSPGIAMYLVMELLQGGDLFDRIVAKEQYTEVESRRVMRRLLSAVYYLHEQRNIVHRDLKPENILCVHSNLQSMEVKLTDFGLAKIINEDDGLKTFCGTPQYFAPEVLERRHTVKGRGRYGKPADMWSLGVILYVLISGRPPFSPMDETPSVEFTDPVWYDMPGAKDLVQKLLREDPKRRLSVRQACDHAWLLMEDGDTHVHPLDDPIVTTRKRLFESSDLTEDATPAAAAATAASPHPDDEEDVPTSPTSHKRIYLAVDNVNRTNSSHDTSSKVQDTTPTQPLVAEENSLTKSQKEGEEDNGSVMSREDFSKSATADTSHDATTMTGKDCHHHRRSGSVVDILEISEGAMIPDIQTTSAHPAGESHPKPKACSNMDCAVSSGVVAALGDSLPDNPSKNLSHNMDVEIVAPKANTSTPPSSSSSMADDGSSNTAVYDVTPSDITNGDERPTSPRSPLIQLSLNQRCNIFREQVLIRVAQKSGTATILDTSPPQEVDTLSGAHPKGDKVEHSELASARKNVLEGLRQGTGAGGTFAFTPTASNRTKLQGPSGTAMCTGSADHYTTMAMEDDISHFSRSEASESLMSFGSSAIGSPLALAMTASKSSPSKTKAATDGDEDANADPNFKKRRRLFPAAASNKDQKEGRGTKCEGEEDERPPAKKAKKPVKNERGRQTLLTAWVVKKLPPTKASSSHERGGSDAE